MINQRNSRREPPQRTVETSGKTVDDAIQNGLRKLRVRRDEVDVEVLDKGSSGFLGIGAKDARVRVSLKPSPAQRRSSLPVSLGRSTPVRVRRPGDYESERSGEPERGSRSEGGRDFGRGESRRDFGRGGPAREPRDTGRDVGRADAGRDLDRGDAGRRDSMRGGSRRGRSQGDRGRELPTAPQAGGRRGRRDGEEDRGAGRGDRAISREREIMEVKAELRRKISRPHSESSVDRLSERAVESRESRETREPREPRDVREPREPRDDREFREPREVREPRSTEMAVGASTEADRELMKQITLYAKGLLDRMGFPVEVETDFSDGAYEVRVQGGDNDAILIGRRGETLEALQHVISKMASRGKEDLVRVRVDVSDYRVRRNEQLAEKARAMAEKVRETGREVVTEPLAAAERRIIHRTLSDVPDVTTHALGDGLVKRVWIGPVGSEGRVAEILENREQPVEEPVLPEDAREGGERHEHREHREHREPREHRDHRGREHRDRRERREPREYRSDSASAEPAPVGETASQPIVEPVSLGDWGAASKPETPDAPEWGRKPKPAKGRRAR